MFKKSSMPLIVGAIICFVLGVSILVSCVVVPTTDSNSESDSEQITPKNRKSIETHVRGNLKIMKMQTPQSPPRLKFSPVQKNLRLLPSLNSPNSPLNLKKSPTFLQKMTLY